MKKIYTTLFVIICSWSAAEANNIAVSNVTLSNRNKGGSFVLVNFDLSWQNSFKTNTGAANWDAAWVFVKFKIGTNGEWKHATLATSGHTLPSGCSATQTDGLGIMLYRSNTGTGTFTLNGVSLRWNYGTDGAGDDDKIYVKVFAIEMVYIPQSEFQLGSGGQNSGEFRQANDLSSSGTSTTFTITASSPTLQGNNTNSSDANLSSYNGVSFDLGTTTNTATLATGFPTGYASFYAMKYEISQSQYRDFLNTLTYSQQVNRTANAPNSAVGTGALVNTISYRNTIEIKTSGTSPSYPAEYGCDFSGNNVFDEFNDGEWITCNYLSWNDVAAYLDWAALRPLTELEYEKLGRGTVAPVVDEYSWGDISLTGLTTITNNRQTSEASSTTNANGVYNSLYGSGPVRVGIFATASSNRTQSGSGYYGVMDLSGNLWEHVITVGNATGRSFTGILGNGTLDTNGIADVANWPDYTGTGKKGGSWVTLAERLRLSDRDQANTGNSTRNNDAGGRGGR